MGQIKAIETKWKGYRFRSRLEARWAVFFERLGWEWKYEPQGFERDGYKYLPDFHINTGRSKYWVEVKGDKDWLKKNKFELEVMHDFGGILPDFYNSGDKLSLDGGLLILGEIPTPEHGLIYFPILAHSKGVNLHWMAIAPSGPVELNQILDFHLGKNAVEYGFASSKDESLNFQPLHCSTPRGWPDVCHALRDARGARFEHGEAPRMGALNDAGF